MGSPEVLSLREIRDRLAAVLKASSHLKQRLEPDSPHNAILRIIDIVPYIGSTTPYYLISAASHDPPASCAKNGHTCTNVSQCPRYPPCRWIPGNAQRRLSEFFREWEAGRLAKIRVGDVWKIVPVRDASLAALAAAKSAETTVTQPHREIAMKIDLKTLGLRVGK